MDALQAHAVDAQADYAQTASLAELQMALEAKARGQNIARLRKRKRLTQQAAADRLGVSYRAYQGWEAGVMPEWPNLEKLASFLGVTPEQIIGEDTPPEPAQLDRIEAKLDNLLRMFSRLELAEALESEARRVSEGQPSSAEDSRGTRRSDQA